VWKENGKHREREFNLRSVRRDEEEKKVISKCNIEMKKGSKREKRGSINEFTTSFFTN
jgi:hypothetical protein